MSQTNSPLMVPQNVRHYQMLARRTQNSELCMADKRMHAVFGISAEAGEIASIFQHYYQGADISKDKVIDELGDLFWFASELCDTFGVPIMEVLRRNIAKLVKRYPDGFDAIRSAHRHEHGED